MKKKMLLLLACSLLSLQGVNGGEKKKDNDKKKECVQEQQQACIPSESCLCPCDPCVCDPCVCDPCISNPCVCNPCISNCCDTCCSPCSTFNLNLNFCGSCYGAVDWLFWRVRRCAVVPSAARATSSELDGGSSDLGSDDCNRGYHSGFRINLGFMPACGDDLEFNVVYTRFAHNSSHHSCGCSSSVNARSKYNINYNVVDLLLGSRYCGCYCNQLRTFVGARLAYIDEKIKSDLCDGGKFAVSSLIRSTLLCEKLRLKAYGLILGFDYTRGLGHYCFDVNFYTRASFSILAGRFKRWDCNESDDSKETFISRSCCCQLLSTQELAVGFEGILQNCGCNCLKITLGYEFHNWLNYSDFIGFRSTKVSDFDMIPNNVAGFGLDGLYLRFASNF